MGDLILMRNVTVGKVDEKGVLQQKEFLAGDEPPGEHLEEFKKIPGLVGQKTKRGIMPLKVKREFLAEDETRFERTDRYRELVAMEEDALPGAAAKVEPQPVGEAEDDPDADGVFGDDEGEDRFEPGGVTPVGPNSPPTPRNAPPSPAKGGKK